MFRDLETRENRWVWYVCGRSWRHRSQTFVLQLKFIPFKFLY
jgi:hypothetical protein